MNDFDIIIVGGGMIGLSTASALSHLPLNIALIDSNGLSTKLLSEKPTLRVSAINASSQRYFAQIGIWDALVTSERVLEFKSIDVKEVHSFAHLSAHSEDFHHENLGYMIENQLIQNVLYEKLDSCSNIHLLTDTVTSIYHASDRAFVTLSNGKVLATKLIIGADGVNSSVRTLSDFKMLQRAYRHHALITTVECQIEHNSCARQLFYHDGIVAFLPLWQSNLNCLVWSLKPEQAQSMLMASPDTFCKELATVTENWLGEYQLINERKVFPLIARYCPQFTMQRTVLIGDAAHTIHPLAGQGANLGFRDAKQLVAMIEKCVSSRQDFGLTSELLKYQIGRQKDVMSMMSAMRVIHSTFDGRSMFKKAIRGVGMNVINTIPLVKTPLIHYALGLQ